MAHGNKGNKNAVKDETAETQLQCRVKKADKAAWVKMAQTENKKLSEWVKDTLNAATDESLK